MIREVDALADGARTQPPVIATGGGIVSSPRASDAAREAFTLWLDCDDDVILARLGDVDRPLLADGPGCEPWRDCGANATAWYAEVSRARVETSMRRSATSRSDDAMKSIG